MLKVLDTYKKKVSISIFVLVSMIPNCSQECLLFCKINTKVFEVHTKKFDFCSLLCTFHYGKLFLRK